jgi:hypothetical protein
MLYNKEMQSRKNNSEKLQTPGTQETGRRQTKQKSQYRKLK